MRMDSMITGIGTREILKDIDGVELRVKMAAKKAGAVQIKYMPSGKNANDIRSYLKEYETKTHKKVDILLVDYLDLMMPISKKVNPGDLFIKDKFVSEELRNLATELGCVVVSAAQFNRVGTEEIEYEHSHIAGGISKIHTADNVFGIYSSRAMRERGKYQLQLMKTRSSSGVGQKIDLDFNVDTLKITDPELEDDNQGSQAVVSSVLDSIKRKSKNPDPIAEHEEVKIKATTNSTMLRQFINNISDPTGSNY
jgi:hypothetical protein